MNRIKSRSVIFLVAVLLYRQINNFFIYIPPFYTDYGKENLNNTFL